MAKAPELSPNAMPKFAETIYLHLQPTLDWQGRIDGMKVVKLAKSLDAQVDPHTRIVKLDVAVAKEFFIDSMPSARLELEPGKVVALVEYLQLEAERGGEAVDRG